MSVFLVEYSQLAEHESGSSTFGTLIHFDSNKSHLLVKIIDPPHTALPAPAHLRAPLFICARYLTLRTTTMPQCLPLLLSNPGRQRIVHRIQNVEVGHGRLQILRTGCRIRTTEVESCTRAGCGGGGFCCRCGRDDRPRKFICLENQLCHGWGLRSRLCEGMVWNWSVRAPVDDGAGRRRVGHIIRNGRTMKPGIR